MNWYDEIDTNELAAQINDKSDNWHFDRIMSLHRKAHVLISGGKDIVCWYLLAAELGCKDTALQVQIWQTAKAAQEAGMSRKAAFPLSSECPQAEHGTNCPDPESCKYYKRYAKDF